MALRIETPEGEEALLEFLRFHDQVYAGRGAAWRAFIPFQLPLLSGTGPFARDRTIRPFVAREDGVIVARAVAAVHHRYVDHWNERLGHIDWFEARPGAREATRRLMDAACGWLAAEGMEAARAGFGLFEFPFVVDDYESLPPSGVRQNPAYYHSLLKEAGFEAEKGWVDYKMEVTAERRGRWESAVEGVRRAGYEIVPLRAVPASRRIAEFADTWDDAFARHWGMIPTSEEGMALILAALEPAGALDTSVLVHREGRPVAAVHAVREITALAVLQPGRVLSDAERLNFLGLGVRPEARGHGLGMGAAAFALLELARRGARWVSYTLVLDDNWPSRRTAEKLGAAVCANYLVYRRSLATPARPRAS
jgi:hypothetical protein